MEATIEQRTIEETKRLLIYSNDQEINRITSDAQVRANLLNELNESGITTDQIKSVCTSLAAIHDFIFREQLKVNEELKKQFEAGKKNLKDEYALPLTLEAIKFGLLAWFNYPSPRGTDKFQFLIFLDKWIVDEQALETHFIRNKVKFYISGEKLSEYREIQTLCSILSKIHMPSNQVRESSILWGLIEPVGNDKYKPRWRNFVED